ncbi:MAG: DUF192 domain-containing protein [Alphaproteobacteria bacterium]|jgi:hypothetical protein|nr:DUF192 domain-containing protein [Alphaproteobacteria bacterium]
MLLPGHNSWADEEIAAPTELLIVVSDKTAHQFQVEVARTPEARGTGLMYRREMAPSHGMLFTFEPSQRVVMWMRNTYISLDMLFIADNGQITSIAENTVPLTDTRISSGRDVRGVLEIVGGLAAKLGLQPGDIVRHPAFGQ